MKEKHHLFALQKCRKRQCFEADLEDMLHRRTNALKGQMNQESMKNLFYLGDMHAKQCTHLSYCHWVEAVCTSSKLYTVSKPHVYARTERNTEPSAMFDHGILLCLCYVPFVGPVAPKILKINPQPSARASWRSLCSQDHTDKKVSRWMGRRWKFVVNRVIWPCRSCNHVSAFDAFGYEKMEISEFQNSLRPISVSSVSCSRSARAKSSSFWVSVSTVSTAVRWTRSKRSKRSARGAGFRCDHGGTGGTSKRCQRLSCLNILPVYLHIISFISNCIHWPNSIIHWHITRTTVNIFKLRNLSCSNNKLPTELRLRPHGLQTKWNSTNTIGLSHTGQRHPLSLDVFRCNHHNVKLGDALDPREELPPSDSSLGHKWSLM